MHLCIYITDSPETYFKIMNEYKAVPEIYKHLKNLFPSRVSALGDTVDPTGGVRLSAQQELRTREPLQVSQPPW